MDFKSDNKKNSTSFNNNRILKIKKKMNHFKCSQGHHNLSHQIPINSFLPQLNLWAEDITENLSQLEEILCFREHANLIKFVWFLRKFLLTHLTYLWFSSVRRFHNPTYRGEGSSWRWFYPYKGGNSLLNLSNSQVSTWNLHS